MSWLRCCTALGMICLFSTAPARADDQAAADAGFAGARTETYKTIGDVKLQIHIFEPADHQPGASRPAIVFFFGGGWKNGLPKQFEHQCRYLASRGMVALTADYRVSSRQGTLVKECVQDAKSAIRWTRANASRLGIDPQRIVAAGGSAGGHLAAATGTIPGWDEPGEDATVSAVPNALVLFNPATTLAAFEGMPAAADERLDGLAARMGTEPANLSPAHHVRPGQPPAIMFFGTKDPLLEGARYFQKQMLAAGNRCDLKLTEGEGHGFFNFGRGNNANFRQTLADADRFLASLGYLSGEPRVEEWYAETKPTAGATQNPRRKKQR